MQVNRFRTFIDRYRVNNHWLRINNLRPRDKIADIDLPIKSRFTDTDGDAYVGSPGLRKGQ